MIICLFKFHTELFGRGKYCHRFQNQIRPDFGISCIHFYEYLSSITRVFPMGLNKIQKEREETAREEKEATTKEAAHLQ